MVSVSASEAGGREFYPGFCSYSVFAIICNVFARQACGKLAGSSFHGDFEAFVNLLQACTLVMTSLWQACTLVMTNLWQACCKLKLLSGVFNSCSVNLLRSKISNDSEMGIEPAFIEVEGKRNNHYTGRGYIRWDKWFIKSFPTSILREWFPKRFARKWVRGLVVRTFSVR
ncbi:hypothetical protein AVEN_63281-1 [Araneus ventricosus]|uniref:Uncharacterized protein n=1 Tax=Araneus ventricosus TaxID=182803 RepID=A0A4Y2SZ55_ARAVE|nr:hypothetical protein AVEN_202745-1 [Araneus ventricosus]GBN93671.1 hypothetical protein AVEN_63281-1 [Araneus ventricosus]